MAKRTARKRAVSTTRTRRRRAIHATATEDAACTIVYIHGIGNKPIESILKCQWDHALFGFDLGERSRLAYWANREYYPTPSAGTCATRDLTEVEEAPTGRALSVEQHLDETTLEAEVEAITGNEREQRVLLKMLRRVDRRAPAAAGSVEAGGVRGFILPLPEPLRRWLTRKLTRAFARDVYDYLFVPDRRERMKASLRQRLDVGGGPFIVIAHSQGTMIAYDVLSEMPEIDVRLFVTMGSPLGIQEVQDQLKRFIGRKSLPVPSCVKRWINVYDDRDPVAADEKLANDYTPKKFIEDVRVANPDSPAHPHSGTGYLSTEQVRTPVQDTARVDLFQRVAPFVIARNVVRGLEDAPQSRHKLLIELADPDGGRPVAELAQELVEAIAKISKLEADDDRLQIQRMRRFLAVNLTRWETECLASTHARPGLSVKRIWRNEAKRALLETSVNAIHARAAHAGYQALGRDVHWAVLDSGVNRGHPHFTLYDNIAAETDCTGRATRTGKGAAPDENGHGTHVAGIIAGGQVFASKSNAPPREIWGVAPQAKLHVYKVLDRNGFGEDAYIIKALDDVAETNERAGSLVIHGVNLSLGGPFDQSTYGCGHTPLCEELRRLWRQGVMVVIAAGNEGFAVLRTLDGELDANIDLSIADPANLEEAITVGSVHKNNPHTYGVSFFSSRGPTADGRQKPDVVAPGEKIVSCRHRMAKKAATLEEQYVAMSGTSMAAPHVSGAVAAFLSVRREFIGEPDRVKAHLVGTCTDLGRDRSMQGAGVPNLVKMLVNI
jgi:pimeloyl-ACP methyl ester carboxylesterase